MERFSVSDETNELTEVAQAMKLSKWDAAHESMQKLIVLNKRRDELFRELGKAIAIERQLERLGIKREDVSRWMYGNAIGATDNFKGNHKVKMCVSDRWGCKGLVRRRFPDHVEKCPHCDADLVWQDMRITPSELRGRYARHLMGVVTNDEKKHWFQEPVSPA